MKALLPLSQLAADRQVSLSPLFQTAVALLLSIGCGHPHEPASPPPSPIPPAQVRVQPAQSTRQLAFQEVAGTLRAKTRATLEAKVSGRIERMPVRLGQQIKAGELIAQLDAGEITARLVQAQATLEQADREWARISSLYQHQAVTRSEQDNAEARQKVAKAAVAEAEALMGYAQVLAPFDGVVSRKWAEAGDLASPGKPLVELEDPTSLQLEADVPERTAQDLSLGAAWSIHVDDMPREFTGTVTEVSPAADPASRTVQVKLELAPAPGLIPGRFARVRVPQGESSTVAVPSAAVVQRGQLEMVFVVTNALAHLHLVKTGKHSGDQVEILSGLDPGEMIAVQGASSLIDQQPVRVE